MKTIPLTQGKVTLVDDEDYPHLMELNWFTNKTRNAHYAAKNPAMVNGVRIAVGFNLDAKEVQTVKAELRNDTPILLGKLEE
jgi:hypothetical protein